MRIVLNINNSGCKNIKMIFKQILLLLYSVNVFAVQKCEKDLFKTKYFNKNTDLNVLLIWYPVETGSLYTMMQLCLTETGLPMKRFCSYDRSSTIGKWDDIPRNTTFVNCSDIDSTCKEEKFKHNYIKRNKISEEFINKWKPAKIEEIGNLQEPCLRETGLPVTRKCLYVPSKRQAQWEPLRENLKNISCLRYTVEKVVTYNLTSLYNKVEEDKKEDKVENKKVAHQMAEILTTPKTVLLPADIKLSSNILKIITENDTKSNLVTEVLNITSIIMDTDSAVIAKSESELNATSTLLDTINGYLDKIGEDVVPTKNCPNNTDGVNVTKSKGLTLFYINPSCSNKSGVAIYSNNYQYNANTNRKDYHYDAHTNRHYRYLFLNQSLDQLLNEPDLLLATYFSQSLWENFKSETAGANNEKILRFMIYRNDILFNNQTKMDLQPSMNENILEIAISKFSGELPDDLPFIYSNDLFTENPQEKRRCGYWHDSTWVTTGVTTYYDSNFLLCRSSHLSSFAALLGAKHRQHSTATEIILHTVMDIHYISIAGCVLSLFGLICIWLTAIFFKSWRSQASNKVLLNMCLVLTLIMIIFLFHNMPDYIRNDVIDLKKRLWCMIIGGFLQYIVLVLFTWMFIIAIMQYQRYVQVFSVNRTPKFIIIYAIIAWGMPLIPTGLVAIFDRESYVPSPDDIINNSDICYPHENSLKFGVLLPVGVLLLANFALFIYIFWSLHRSLKKFKSKRDRENTKAEVRLSVLLFFLLGISWIFGMVAYVDKTSICSYLFCLTSTLQGFVLFIYSVVIDESTRYSWITCCCAKNYYTREKINNSSY